MGIAILHSIDDKAIKQEASLDKAEDRILTWKTIPLTMTEVTILEEIVRYLAELETSLKTGIFRVSQPSHEDMARHFEAMMGTENLFRGNMVKLDTVFKRITILAQHQLQAEKAPFKKNQCKEQKGHRAELQLQEQIVLTEHAVRNLERKMGLNLRSFNKNLAEAAHFLRRSPYMRDAVPFVSRARRDLRNTINITASIKGRGKRLVHLIKLEQGLFPKEDKAV